MEYESPCSCLKRYRKYVGVFDIILGIIGVVKMLCFTYLNRSKWLGLENGKEKLPFLASELEVELTALDKELQTEAILYFVPSLLVIVLGILIIVAAKKDSFSWSKMAMLMNMVFIGICGGIVSIVFGLGTYWIKLIPLVTVMGIQLVFSAVVIELYHSTQHLVKLK